VARSAKITSRLSRRWLLVLSPGKARARQSDAGVALAAGGDSEVGTTGAYGHAHAGQRKTEMHTRQQFQAALKTEAHSLFMSAQTRDLCNLVPDDRSLPGVAVRSDVRSLETHDASDY